MNLSIGFSPCPNDTFIFDAMVHQKVDTEGLSFDVFLDDVEALNQKAFRKEFTVTKLSYHAFAYLLEHYILLDSGSALGKNCGPLLIAKQAFDAKKISSLRIAIPGEYTTAHFLLKLAFPNALSKETMIFSAIEAAVLSEQVDAGLIIHENRFTYADRGLVKLLDLGEFWETKTQLPIPLGGIVVDRNLSKPLQEKINRVLRRSIEFAMAHPEQSGAFVEQHAQEMDKKVMAQHIELYVNEYSLSLGETGRKAVKTLFELASKQTLIEASDLPIFV